MHGFESLTGALWPAPRAPSPTDIDIGYVGGNFWRWYDGVSNGQSSVKHLWEPSVGPWQHF